jgi:hypothetical protein
MRILGQCATLKDPRRYDESFENTERMYPGEDLISRKDTSAYGDATYSRECALEDTPTEDICSPQRAYYMLPPRLSSRIFRRYVRPMYLRKV